MFACPMPALFVRKSVEREELHALFFVSILPCFCRSDLRCYRGLQIRLGNPSNEVFPAKPCHSQLDQCTIANDRLSQKIGRVPVVPGRKSLSVCLLSADCSRSFSTSMSTCFAYAWPVCPPTAFHLDDRLARCQFEMSSPYCASSLVSRYLCFG